MTNPVRIPASELPPTIARGIEDSKADLRRAMEMRWNHASITVNGEARDEGGVLAVHVHARITDGVKG